MLGSREIYFQTLLEMIFFPKFLDFGKKPENNPSYSQFVKLNALIYLVLKNTIALWYVNECKFLGWKDAIWADLSRFGRT